MSDKGGTGNSADRVILVDTSVIIDGRDGRYCPNWIPGR